MQIQDDRYSTERTSDEYLTLNSCGIQNLDEYDRGSFRPKGRVDYHILYIEKGICHLTLDGEERPVGAGGIVLFRPGEPQIYSFLASEGSISHYIHFTGAGCEALLSELGIDRLRVFDMGASRTYEEISAKMVREFTMKKQHWESFCAAYLHELLNIIARKYGLRHSRINHVSESRIDAACRAIYENLVSPPDARELASACCLSESRFLHIFREATGKSLKEFTISMRIDRAKSMLSATDMSVREIAEVVGYDDQSYFSRIFKQAAGMSPSEYRKSML